MKTMILTTAATVLALSMSFGSASFACDEGCTDDPPVDTSKGDNGWGNGADGINPGTDEGNARQVSTKANPQSPVYDLDKVARFGGR
ncbi:MAG TPA: hypothetical protein VK146_12130 [Tabrizicola sp.]|nr:hypothetical protein [Tabrizicola sp.]